jgi:hypothetical protein
MDGKTARAKFCHRDCQVAHLRAHGPTERAADPSTVPATVSIRLSEDDREHLRVLAERMVMSPRRVAEVVLHDRLEVLAR